MKKRNLFLLLPLFLLAACESPEPSTPEAVAKAYAEAFAEVDLDAAKAFATVNGGKQLETWKKLMAIDTSSRLQPRALKLDQISCDIQENTAECKLCCAQDGSALLPLRLVKEQGKWRVEPEPINVKD